MRHPPVPVDPDVEARRKRARRTAWLFAGIALAVYVGFILSGALGRH
ncbi:hypothetical protein [Thermomonas sp.]